MNPLTDWFRKSPAVPRVAPFVVFLLLTWLQGQCGEAGRYWIYLAKTLVGGWLLWLARPWIAEMKWAWSWEALIAGIAVFGLWVGLDGLYPSLSDLFRRVGLTWLAGSNEAPATPWNPHVQFGQGSALAWFFIVVRLIGPSLVVPPLEEVFYRSFLCRYLAKPDFETVPLGAWRWGPVLATAAVFGLTHHEWLAGILCALIYQALVTHKQRLGDAITAHAVTNLLLGLWVVTRGAWKFW